MRFISITGIFICFTISGCGGTLKLALMPKDSGKIYNGQLVSDGMGSGTATVNIDGQICYGPVARVSSSDVVGISSTMGASGGRTFSASSIGVAGSGDTTVKVLLSCPDGSGMRCELTGQSSRGGGICIDDKGRKYDVIANP